MTNPANRPDRDLAVLYEASRAYGDASDRLLRLLVAQLMHGGPRSGVDDLFTVEIQAAWQDKIVAFVRLRELEGYSRRHAELLARHDRALIDRAYQFTADEGAELDALNAAARDEAERLRRHVEEQMKRFPK